jgi:hypothetical protein
MDDGQLKCLPHPGERWASEREGLTLEQAAERGRLYRETFFVCRHCGKDGEIIEKFEKYVGFDWKQLTISVRQAIKWCWGSAAILIAFFAWMRWWEPAVIFGVTLLSVPCVFWWDNRRTAKEYSRPDLPRDDAPGRVPIAAPVAGCWDELATIVGEVLMKDADSIQATGSCCDQPDWVYAGRVTDADRITCSACGKGVMVLSEHSIH